MQSTKSKSVSEHMIQKRHCESIVQGFTPLGSDLEWSWGLRVHLVHVNMGETQTLLTKQPLSVRSRKLATTSYHKAGGKYHRCLCAGSVQECTHEDGACGRVECYIRTSNLSLPVKMLVFIHLHGWFGRVPPEILVVPMCLMVAYWQSSTSCLTAVCSEAMLVESSWKCMPSAVGWYVVFNRQILSLLAY